MTTLEYPALICKSKKNNVFIASCIMKNLVGYGKTEQAAISNLEGCLTGLEKDYLIKVLPVYRLKMCR